MTRPLVSVIIPTYNRATLLPSAIDSVLAQTYQPVEIVVVDDGSTDDTQQVLARYGEHIRVVIQKNAGPSAARNRGIVAAKGDIVAFLDSDDRWLPRKLERQVASLEAAGPAVACCLCNCTVQYANGETTSTFAIADTMPECETGIWMNPVEVLLNRFVLFNQAVAVRKAALDRVGYFYEALRFGEDHELSFRLALEGPWTILREELAVYHEASPGSLAKAAVREQVRLREDIVSIRTRMAELVNADPELHPLRGLADRELRIARRELSIAELGRRRVPGASAAARSLRFVERLRRAAFRRSAAYPRMRVLQADAPPPRL